MSDKKRTILVPVIAKSYVKIKIDAKDFPEDFDDWDVDEWGKIREEVDEKTLDLSPDWEIDEDEELEDDY